MKHFIVRKNSTMADFWTAVSVNAKTSIRDSYGFPMPSWVRDNGERVNPDLSGPVPTTFEDLNPSTIIP